MPDSDEHENDIYEDEEIELSDDDPPAPMVGSFISVYIFRFSFLSFFQYLNLQPPQDLVINNPTSKVNSNTIVQCEAK